MPPTVSGPSHWPQRLHHHSRTRQRPAPATLQQMAPSGMSKQSKTLRRSCTLATSVQSPLLFCEQSNAAISTHGQVSPRPLSQSTLPSLLQPAKDISEWNRRISNRLSPSRPISLSLRHSTLLLHQNATMHAPTLLLPPSCQPTSSKSPTPIRRASSPSNRPADTTMS